MRSAGPLLLGLLVAVPAAAEVTVRVVPAVGGAAQHVELTARAAPLTEVLDRLGRQIGMKVVYEGASPRQLVTVSLQGRSPIEAVLALLDGQGVNFALLSDPTGTRVESLLVAGSAPATAAATGGTYAGRSTSASAPSFRRPLGPPPGSGPDTVDEPEDAEDAIDEPVAGAPEAPEAAPAGTQPDPAASQVPVPHAPGALAPSYPVSPFAPSTAPVTTQPFPPLPPGVPGGPTGTQPATPQQPEQPTNAPPGA